MNLIDYGVYYILNNDDSDANTYGIADAVLYYHLHHQMELWLDESDESTMIKQANESTSIDNINISYLCVAGCISNIKSQLKLYLVNESADALPIHIHLKNYLQLHGSKL